MPQPFIYLLLALMIGQYALGQDKGIKIVGGTAPAGTERRIALVVGNKDYQHVRKLQNPVNDATDMTTALKALGFEVITLTNTSYPQLQSGLNRFKDKLTTSDVALVYYSGHGVSYNGKNYLLPVDADIQCLEQVEEYGISLSRILSDLASRHVRNSFVFLDACRNLPDRQVCNKTSRDLTGQPGLVRPTNNPRGSMVVFATREGSTADDNPLENNGLFTSELLKYLLQPGLRLRDMIDSTSAGVRRRSNGNQQPGRYDELEGDFTFLLPSSTPSSAVQPKPTGQAKADLPVSGISPARVAEIQREVIRYRRQNTLFLGSSAGVFVAGAATLLIANSTYGNYTAEVARRNNDYFLQYQINYPGQIPPASDLINPLSRIGYLRGSLAIAGVAVAGSAVLWYVSTGYRRKYRLTNQQLRQLTMVSPLYHPTERWGGVSLALRF